MQTVIKILLNYDAPDTVAARKRFREILADLQPHLPEDCDLRDFKMVEDGSGRVIEKWEPEG